jgi:hypothetical protein
MANNLSFEKKTRIISALAEDCSIRGIMRLGVRVGQVGHPKATACYAWGHHAGKDNKQSRYVVVLKIPPVDSPAAAVRASIASDSIKR